MHQLINFSIIIDIAARFKSSDFCQGHPCWECAPPLSCTSHLEKPTDRQAEKNGKLTGRKTGWLLQSNKENKHRYNAEELKTGIVQDDDDDVENSDDEMRHSSNFLTRTIRAVFWFFCRCLLICLYINYFLLLLAVFEFCPLLIMYFCV